jgi:hypothetical protein
VPTPGKTYEICNCNIVTISHAKETYIAPTPG